MLQKFSARIGELCTGRAVLRARVGDARRALVARSDSRVRPVRSGGARRSTRHESERGARRRNHACIARGRAPRHLRTCERFRARRRRRRQRVAAKQKETRPQGTL